MAGLHSWLATQVKLDQREQEERYFEIVKPVKYESRWPDAEGQKDNLCVTNIVTLNLFDFTEVSYSIVMNASYNDTKIKNGFNWKA